jgi:hypothetical protein
MPHDINTVAGSGTVANMQPQSPLYAFPEGTFPVPNARDSLRNRRAESVAIINPSDFSVGIGGRTTQVTVGISAVQILPSPLEFRRALVIHNDGASIVYLGFTAAVTAADGFPLANGEKIAIDMVGNPNMLVWLISAGTSDIRLLELA